MRVAIINGNSDYRLMFTERGHEIVDLYEQPDMVQFTGGHDISPEIYGCKMHNTMSTNPGRDRDEIKIYKFCRENNIPMAGICRGSQFLHAMSGEKLWQDVDNHAVGEGHSATIVGNLFSVVVSSTHHQMMAEPTNPDSIVLVEASLSTHKIRIEENGAVVDDGSTRDIESCYHPQCNSLSFQPHPEFRKFEECRKLYFNLLDNFLLAG